MSDHILRAITSDGLVQAAAISSRDLTERARHFRGFFRVRCLPLPGAVQSSCAARQDLRHFLLFCLFCVILREGFCEIRSFPSPFFFLV